MNSTIVFANGKQRKVKNLGWILRHWKEIRGFSFAYYPNTKTMVDGELIAFLKGGFYVTDFSCLSVCWNFLNRSIYKGLPFRLVDKNLKTSDFIIGDAKWKEINELEYKNFFGFLGLTGQ
jgi:hypothetical protein